MIEHNLDVIKTADWLIDMGPEGGDEGGLVMGTGTPEEIAATPGSVTGDFLRRAAAGAETPTRRSAQGRGGGLALRRQPPVRRARNAPPREPSSCEPRWQRVALPWKPREGSRGGHCAPG